MPLKTVCSFLLIGVLLSGLSGCAVLNDPERKARKEAMNASLRESNYQLAAFKTIGVLSPDINLFEYSTGIHELMDDWSLQSNRIFADTLNRELPKEGLVIKTIELSADSAARMRPLHFLYRAISDGLGWNTEYRKAVCPDIQTCPDYSLGNVSDILDAHHVDALLFVLSYNEIETPERASARSASKAKAAFIGALAGVSVKVLRPPGTYVSMALVDRTGTVVWYVGRSTDKGYDLRDPVRVEDMTKDALVKLWAKEKR